MSNVSKLLEKAMSTTSDSEALACLRKAKKLSGGFVEEQKPAKDYYKEALHYQNIALKLQKDRESYYQIALQFQTEKQELTDKYNKLLKKNITNNTNKRSISYYTISIIIYTIITTGIFLLIL